MARFDLSDYETVEDRLIKFWNDNPTGRVQTDLIAYGDKQFIVKAEIYRGREDDRPWATGYAEEIVTDRGVNATSALENCETSAIGRALANAGYATKGKRPSREEMAKVERGAKAAAKPVLDDDQMAAVRAAAAAVAEITDQDALRAFWSDWSEWLDAEFDGTTLKKVILARKDAIGVAA